MTMTLGELRRRIGVSAAFMPLDYKPGTMPGIFGINTYVNSIPTTFVLVGEQRSDDSELFGRIERYGSFFHVYEGSDFTGGERTGIFPAAELAYAHLTGASISVCKRIAAAIGVATADLLDSRIVRRLRGHKNF